MDKMEEGWENFKKIIKIAWPHYLTSPIAFMIAVIIHFGLRMITNEHSMFNCVPLYGIFDPYCTANWKMGTFLILFGMILFILNLLLAGLYTHKKITEQECQKDDKEKSWLYALIPAFVSVIGDPGISKLIILIPILGQLLMPLITVFIPPGPFVASGILFVGPMLTKIPIIGTIVRLLIKLLGNWLVLFAMAIFGWGLMPLIGAVISGAVIKSKVCT